MTTSSELLAERSRADLATIGRELMLAAHLQDRAAIPSVLRRHTMEEAFEVAIDEWMTASPIYTQRLQRLLGYEGTGMTTIFKGLQLDVGFPHQFMDVGYELHDERSGQFWLRACGALADVVPMGEPFVRGMCHDIEDPTFDATAVATNARARVRPVHRPPGVPLGGPDCHWTVVIDDDAEPVAPHPELAGMARSVVARLPNEAGPWHTGPFDPNFELEHLPAEALPVVLREFAVQGHLLARAAMCAVDRRWGHEEAVELGRSVFCGVGWLGAERLAAALGIGPSWPGALAAVLPLTHLLLPHDHVGVDVLDGGDGTTTLVLSGDAAGLAEGDPYSLAGLLALGADEIVEALVHGVDPTATVAAEPGGDGGRVWTVTPAPAGERAPEPDPVTLVRFSTGAAVTLRRRVPRP